MKNVRTWSELEKALKEKAETVVLEKLKNGEVSNYCPVCKSEQVIKLVDDKAKCTICDNEFDIQAIVS